MILSRKAKLLGHGATAGYLFYLGVFTLIGAFVIPLPIGWALATIFFSVAIEGTVYAKNIFKGIENSNTELALQHALAIKQLKKLKKRCPDNQFVTTYYKMKGHLHDLRESHKHDADTEAKIKGATKFLIQLEALVIKCLNDTESKKNTSPKDNIGLLTPQDAHSQQTEHGHHHTQSEGSGSLHEDDKVSSYDKIIAHISQLINEEDRQIFKTTLANRSPYMFISKVMSLFSGAFSAISAAAVMYSHLTSPFGMGIVAKIGISFAMAAGISIPVVAILVLVGSGLVMYGTASEIIKHGGTDSLFMKIDQFLGLQRTDNTCLGYVKKSVFYILVGALILFSTGATIYSFFSPIIEIPIKLILTTFLMVVIIILAITSSALTLIFNTANTLDSLQNIKDIFADIADKWKNKVSYFGFVTQFDAFKEDTTWLQIFNPFRLASHLILILHAICIGISADKFPPFPSWIVIPLNTLLEWVSDFHYVSPNKSKQDLSNTTKPARLEEEEDHDHGSLLEIVVIPFNAVAVVWDYFAGGCGSWQASKNKFFPSTQTHEVNVPSIPLEFIQYHLNLELDEQIIKYEKQATKTPGQNNLPRKKVKEFKKLQQKIKEKKEEDFSSFLTAESKKYQEDKSATNSNNTFSTSSSLPLAQHQNSIRFFKSTPPASLQNVRTLLDGAIRLLNAPTKGG